jgi:paraquat-inducible protein A
VNDAMPEVLTCPQMRLYSCHVCGRVSQCLRDTGDQALHCPRCSAPLHHRRPGSLDKTWACVIAAILLYLPANLLPIMATNSVFGNNQHTILGGVAELWGAGDWALALIVFVASIVVPIGKIGALMVLLVTAQRNSTWRSRERSRLFRLVEAVGHWSMLDVYVVLLVVGMIRFGAFAGAAPEPGLLAFGAVVVLTMLATEAFDPRLLWPDTALPENKNKRR